MWFQEGNFGNNCCEFVCFEESDFSMNCCEFVCLNREAHFGVQCFLLCVSFCLCILEHNCIGVGVGAIGVLSIL